MINFSFGGRNVVSSEIEVICYVVYKDVVFVFVVGNDSLSSFDYLVKLVDELGIVVGLVEGNGKFFFFFNKVGN